MKFPIPTMKSCGVIEMIQTSDGSNTFIKILSTNPRGLPPRRTGGIQDYDDLERFLRADKPTDRNHSLCKGAVLPS